MSTGRDTRHGQVPNKPMIVFRVILTIAGAAAAIPYLGFAMFIAFAQIAGDCFPETNASCPTDAERTFSALAVTAIAALIFGGLCFLWFKLYKWLARRGGGAAPRRRDTGSGGRV
ncbi:hypothetical protein [Allosphingosinicella indica]|uniref:Uncharacterized protein n=1 Tax=Allosphingosinicella indica TaxID=941907 RepID=A0A1X7GRL4_9SPHN|nr:hypothetical protein [Allosphingosinicella indica]SMF73544.1 hypothetical protein SAMN06295910_2146 [Allosphingosinicella indica]